MGRQSRQGRKTLLLQAPYPAFGGCSDLYLPVDAHFRSVPRRQKPRHPGQSEVLSYVLPAFLDNRRYSHKRRRNRCNGARPERPVRQGCTGY